MSNTATAMHGLLEAEFFDFESTFVGDTLRIFVGKPPFVPPGKHPAIYAVDGNSAFAMTLSIQRMLAWGAEAPPAYVIGIGYPSEGGYVQALGKRNRDLAPTQSGDYAQRVLGSTYAANGSAFLRCIIEELKPFLATRYPIDAADATLFGSSLGGLFGAWTLLNAPTTFQRYVLASPAIWWNDEEVWQWEAARAAATRTLDAKVFISAGALEYPEAMRQAAVHVAANNPLLRAQVQSVMDWHDTHGWPRTTALCESLAAQLQSRNYAGLSVHCQNLPEENHMSVAPAVISRGLRYVFGSWRPR
jgi:predicted alpha/beta superfamily hydrolase